MTEGRHSCIAANYPSFDHLIGSKRRRDRDAEHSGGLEVDGQSEFARREMGISLGFAPVGMSARAPTLKPP
jgi:hypothetical protein